MPKPLTPETMAVLDAIYAGLVQLTREEECVETREGMAAARYWVGGYVLGEHGINLAARFQEASDAL